MTRTARPLIAVAVVALAMLVLTGCGGGEQHVALAVTGTSWAPGGRLVVRTECATVTDAELVPSTDGSPPTLTIWGNPKVGRCRPQLVIPVPADTTKVVDAASSEIIDLPART